MIAAFLKGIKKGINYGLDSESGGQNLSTYNLYPVKTALKNEGDIKTVLDKWKLKAFVAIRLMLEHSNDRESSLGRREIISDGN